MPSSSLVPSDPTVLLTIAGTQTTGRSPFPHQLYSTHLAEKHLDPPAQCAQILHSHIKLVDQTVYQLVDQTVYSCTPDWVFFSTHNLLFTIPTPIGCR
jgi:hypothetical protein